MRTTAGFHEPRHLHTPATGPPPRPLAAAQWLRQELESKTPESARVAHLATLPRFGEIPAKGHADLRTCLLDIQDSALCAAYFDSPGWVDGALNQSIGSFEFVRWCPGICWLARAGAFLSC